MTRTRHFDVEDDYLDDAVEVANVPTLLLVLVQLTGDTRWLEAPYVPTQTQGLSDNDSGGLPLVVQREVRRAAAAAIRQWMQDGHVAIPEPSPNLLLRMMTVSMGESIPTEYAPMMADELRRFHEPEPPSLEVPHDFGVVVVGAGVSGICAAVYLQRAGIPFTLIERSESVGGTWHQNRYPGVGVDTPSHIYEYSFAPHDWPYYFSRGQDVAEYLEGVVDDFNLGPHIRLGCEVLQAAYDEQRQLWSVRIRTSDSEESTLEAPGLISAVGAFGQPKWPELRGADTFAGLSFHSARWPHDASIAGKRVAVIGNGASAMQIVPASADEASSITVFQRSPQWAAPFEKFKRAVPEEIRRLLRDVPLYAIWYRLRLGWIFNDRTYESLQVDPDWPESERSINAINEGHRRFLERYIRAELGEREDLISKVLPDYPPFGKRMLLDNGWFRTLRRDDVHLVTEPIDEVRPTGIVTTDGEMHEADVIIYATGFDVARFLGTVDIVGRGGLHLRDFWDDDNAKAYLGTSIPGFPNLFALYGPNLQTAGGSLIFVLECQMHYIMSLMRQMLDRDLGAVECRTEVYEAYNREVDATHDRMIWSHPGMDTYYRNDRGRVVVVNPHRVVDFWHRTREADLDDYLTEPRRPTDADGARQRMR